jgi:hypothetical protein
VCEEVFLLLIRKMTDAKIEQHTNIIFLAILKKPPPKRTGCYVKFMEKIPYHEHMSLNGTEGFQEEEKMWKMTNDLLVQ